MLLAVHPTSAHEPASSLQVLHNTTNVVHHRRSVGYFCTPDDVHNDARNMLS
jgi:hypothetical protein